MLVEGIERGLDIRVSGTEFHEGKRPRRQVVAHEFVGECGQRRIRAVGDEHADHLGACVGDHLAACVYRLTNLVRRASHRAH